MVVRDKLAHLQLPFQAFCLSLDPSFTNIDPEEDDIDAPSPSSPLGIMSLYVAFDQLANDPTSVQSTLATEDATAKVIVRTNTPRVTTIDPNVSASVAAMAATVGADAPEGGSGATVIVGAEIDAGVPPADDSHHVLCLFHLLIAFLITNTSLECHRCRSLWIHLPPRAVLERRIPMTTGE
ncbi:hypothetical protein GUJ93_ZPchr0011g27764 [Zizania palustris]|uniref:Uncharacterized protein n=1 Tax=Zizania palustris TaxID=103762 RepID=A0A8J6BNZ2_ZIZPA|nr:hypothetical protein GUJ93_ZPchr0011g27764 [Zizania palustris]